MVSWSKDSYPTGVVKVSDVQMGNFFMPGKVLNTIYFLKGNNADNSNLILLGLEKQRGITLEA